MVRQKLEFSSSQHGRVSMKSYTHYNAMRTDALMLLETYIHTHQETNKAWPDVLLSKVQLHLMFLGLDADITCSPHCNCRNTSPQAPRST